MGWLLHSKMFREKLTKWIMMYVAVMCLLGSVITYSKYISSLGNQDPSETRSAMFDIAITPAESMQCSERDLEIKNEDKSEIYHVNGCSVSGRPTSTFEYAFNIDFSKLEVNTRVLTRIAFGEAAINSLKNVFLYEIKEDGTEVLIFDYDTHQNDEKVFQKVEDSEDFYIKRGNGTILLDNRIKNIVVKDTDKLEQNYSNKKFKITFEFNTPDLSDPGTGELVKEKDEEYKDLITVGYTAIQFIDENEISLQD